jgi:hypothetical protein
MPAARRSRRGEPRERVRAAGARPFGGKYTVEQELGKLAARVVSVSGAKVVPARASRVSSGAPVMKKPFQAAELEGTVLELLAS